MRAMRRGRAHPSLTGFRLCKEFGWTPEQLNRQSAKTVEEYIVVLNEMDREAEAEVEKAKRGAHNVN